MAAEYLFSRWDGLRGKFKKGFIFLFLDYDGTLTGIVSSPDKAIIPDKNKRLLSSLSKSPFCKVAVISGRSLKNIRRIVGVKGLIYAGNHGLQIEGPKTAFKINLQVGFKAALNKIKKELVRGLSGIKGVLIEDKGLTLSLHFRLVEEGKVPLVKKIFNKILIPYLAAKRARIVTGKKVYEIRPPAKWDKGKAVLWLLQREKGFNVKRQVIPVYIGDDVTDEDAFKALGRKGLTIFVGSRPALSGARYYLKDTGEVTDLLTRISRLAKD